MQAKRWALAGVVVACASAFADEVVLTTGEVLTVTNVVREGGRVRMDHAVLGALDLPANQVAAVRPSGAPGGVAAPAPAPAPPAPPPPPPPAWKYRAEVGVNGQSGNTRTRDLRAAIGALLEEPEHRWKFDAVYQQARADGEETRHQWYVEGLKDWLFPDTPWLVFATARYDRDAYQDWDERLSVGAGVGYRFVDTERLKVRGRLGLNALREWGTDDDTWRPEGLVGAEVNWTINDMQSLEGSTTWYPDLEDGGEYRLVSKLAWSVKLSRTAALSLKLGIEDEYDSHRERPFERNDLKYFLALLYEF